MPLRNGLSMEVPETHRVHSKTETVLDAYYDV